MTIKWRFLIRLALALIAVCGLFLCLGVYPFAVSLSALSSAAPDALATAWLVFLWLVSLPCFLILILAWRICGAKDAVFSGRTAGSIKMCARVLLIDVCVLVSGSMIFELLRVIDLFLPYVLLCAAAGLAVSILIWALSGSIAKAAALQEENEGTI